MRNKAIPVIDLFAGLRDYGVRQRRGAKAGTARKPPRKPRRGCYHPSHIGSGHRSCRIGARRAGGKQCRCCAYCFARRGNHRKASRVEWHRPQLKLCEPNGCHTPANGLGRVGF